MAVAAQDFGLLVFRQGAGGLFDGFHLGGEIGAEFGEDVVTVL